MKDQYSVKQCARFMDVLFHHDNGAVLWHCSLGKRPGRGDDSPSSMRSWGAQGRDPGGFAALQYLSGRRVGLYAPLPGANKLDSIDNVNKVSALFKVKEEYLDRLFAAIYTEYGKGGALFAQGDCT